MEVTTNNSLEDYKMSLVSRKHLPALAYTSAQDMGRKSN
jgi:hypothetical protein